MKLATACPKPRRRKKKAPKPIRRSAPIARKALPNTAKPRKAIKKVNPERQAKRRQLYAKKLAVYRRSETCKVVKLRAGGQCEATLVYSPDGPGVRLADVLEHREWEAGIHPRCLGEAPLTDHHTTYARLGGKELPTDICRACRRCNAFLESKHPTRRRNYSR